MEKKALQIIYKRLNFDRATDPSEIQFWATDKKMYELSIDDLPYQWEKAFGKFSGVDQYQNDVPSEDLYYDALENPEQYYGDKAYLWFANQHVDKWEIVEDAEDFKDVKVGTMLKVVSSEYGLVVLKDENEQEFYMPTHKNAILIFSDAVRIAYDNKQNLIAKQRA